jgi:NAD-dependent SIR2 family protein deacetylase
MLEEKAGLETGLGRQFSCIPLHGSLAHLQCSLCHEAYEWEMYRDDIRAERDIRCSRCTTRCTNREANGRRRLPIGQLRPSIIMLDSVHPEGAAIASLIQRDHDARIDVLLILGTSLKVDGPRSLALHAFQSDLCQPAQPPPSADNGWLQAGIRRVKHCLAPGFVEGILEAFLISRSIRALKFRFRCLLCRG